MSALKKRSREETKEKRKTKRRKLSEEESVEVDGNEEKEETKAEQEESESQEEEEVPEYWEISAKKRVRVATFKGHPLVHIREYYKDRTTGEEKPGKGTALSIAEFDALVKLMPQLTKHVNKMRK